MCVDVLHSRACVIRVWHSCQYVCVCMVTCHIYSVLTVKRLTAFRARHRRKSHWVLVKFVPRETETNWQIERAKGRKTDTPVERTNLKMIFFLLSFSVSVCVCIPVHWCIYICLSVIL